MIRHGGIPVPAGFQAKGDGMDRISAISASVDACNAILAMATEKNLEQANRMIRVAAEGKVGKEHGKGAQFDTVA
jgi:hypothetical protein